MARRSEVDRRASRGWVRQSVSDYGMHKDAPAPVLPMALLPRGVVRVRPLQYELRRAQSRGQRR